MPRRIRYKATLEEEEAMLAPAPQCLLVADKPLSLVTEALSLFFLSSFSAYELEVISDR
ncbi:hypothetical protein [Texcoconibacillus texcoconensis]|uniref:Uncharacterized protein n=1 Tax=Texcoconibacillus texcoconensis TaxID=1095777 RepID=A0A840QRZ5_9BACI|nr:hypothetical protein [Texcoconibacillus texcoconensis]MBB5174057.1 hypothetical protein [Texcoconibacillus texcoconensis]